MPVVVSGKFIETLKAAGSTGWSTFPVTVYDKAGRNALGYQGFQVVGVCGDIDWSRSTPVPVTYPGGTFPMLQGMFIDERSWDGSDVFGPPDTGHVFMSDKTANALTQAKITNMNLEAVEDVRSDIWPGDRQPQWKHLYRKRWEDLSTGDLKPRP